MGAFVLPAIGAGLSFLGGLFGGKRKEQTNTTQTTTPSMDPAFGPLRDILLARSMRGLQSRSPLPAGFVNQRMQDTNDVFAGVRRALGNRLAGAGVRGGAAGAGIGTVEAGRGAELSRGLNEIPMIENDLRQQQLAQAMALLSMGRGTTTTGASTGTTGAGGFGGGLDSLGAFLGFLYGNRGLEQKKPAPVPTGSVE